MEYTDGFIRQAGFILDNSGLDLFNFAQVQLGCEPLDSGRKRVKQIDEKRWSLGCRTWRINFEPDMVLRKIKVVSVESNYLPEELLAGAEDRYMDKDIHRKFIREFN